MFDCRTKCRSNAPIGYSSVTVIAHGSYTNPGSVTAFYARVTCS